jgi:hypothetical protein
LTLGTDEGLKTAATDDLAANADSEAATQAGDSWWKLAEVGSSPHAEAMRQRAVYWYRQAINGATGIAKLRLEKRLATADAALASAPGSGPTRSTSGRTSITRTREKLIEFAGEVVKAKTAGRSQELGSRSSRSSEFWISPENGGLLVGFDISLNSSNRIVAFRPIFHTLKGKINGPTAGTTDVKNIRVVARKGYAVGAISLKTGSYIYGMGLVFQGITEKGLDPSKQYLSDWIGSGTTSTRTIGGDGKPIIGIYGHYSTKVTALGIVTAPKKP